MKVTTGLGFQATVTGMRGDYVHVRYDEGCGSAVRVNVLKIETLRSPHGGNPEKRPSG